MKWWRYLPWRGAVALLFTVFFLPQGWMPVLLIVTLVLLVVLLLLRYI